MEVLWIGKTGDANVWYHIYPFSQVKEIKKIHIVRYSEPKRKIPNSATYTFNDKPSFLGLFRMFFKASSVIKKNNIQYIVTFNPVPWGAVAWLISKIYRIPISLGYIGADFYKYFNSPNIIQSFLTFISKRSDIITVTGSNMLNKFSDLGIEESRIIIYPHCVDDSWFITNINKHKEYDIITVCNLEKRKRIEDILKALEFLKSHHNIILKFCLVGDGEQMLYLKKLSEELEINNQIDFVGHQEDVLPFLLQSKIYVQTSDNEGLSLSLIEAIAAGLIPITTIAGSEEDIIIHNKTGLFIPIGNHKKLAEQILYLLNNNEFERIKKNIMDYRFNFSINNAISVCERITKKLVI